MVLYKLQGSLHIIFQLCITIGILIANVVNYLTPKIKGGYGWHVSLGGTTILALFIVTSSFFLPNTPNSMLEKNEPEKGRAILKWIHGVSDKEIKAKFEDLVATSEASKALKHPWRNIQNRKYRPQLIRSMAIPYFQQLGLGIEEGKNLGWQISMKWAWQFHICGPIEDGPNVCKECYGRILHGGMQQGQI